MYLFQVDSEKAGKEKTAAWLKSQGHIFCTNSHSGYKCRWWHVMSEDHPEFDDYRFDIFQDSLPIRGIKTIEITNKRKVIGGI